MAIWQVMKNGAPTGQMVDDGLELEAGDENFTSEFALELSEELGGDGVNYVGRSNNFPDEV